MIDRYKIEFTQWAETDLDHIVMYIAENDSVSRAVEVYLKIKEKIFSLLIISNELKTCQFFKGLPEIPENILTI